MIVPTLGAKKLPTRIQSIAAAYPHHRAVPFTEIGTKRLGVQCGMHCCLLRAWRVPQWRQLRAALVFSMRTRTLLCQWQCWNASVSCRHLCRLSGRSIARRMRGVCQRNLLARKRQCVFELPPPASPAVPAPSRNACRQRIPMPHLCSASRAPQAGFAQATGHTLPSHVRRATFQAVGQRRVHRAEREAFQLVERLSV